MAEALTWGILGTGSIAKTFARGVAKSKTGKLVAVGSRNHATAAAFAEEFKIPNAHASYEALLADPKVQAIYIATPHPMHAQWAIRCAEAKKHILCEKPIGLNQAEAMAIIEAAIANDVFLMEAYMYRCHPQTATLVELIKSKAIGDVRVIQATFSFHWPRPWNGTSRLTDNAMGGGGILDVGGYPVSMARLIAGAATGKAFEEPIQVKGCGHVGPTGVDEWAVASLKFPGDIVAQLATGVQVQQENIVRIDGTDGSIVLPTPWIPAREGGTTKIIVHKRGQEKPEEITIECGEYLYGLEADTVARNLEKRQAAAPAMSWDDTLGNMRTLDRWRAELGQTYDAEKVEAIPTVDRRPLAVRPKNNMKYAKIDGLDLPVSRLVMGCDNQPNLPHAAVMFDDFFARGGNTFDTAHIYGGGLQEKLLGQWIRNRGVREKIVLIVKGGHTPYCDPRSLTPQLNQSLERLQADRADIYIMHRDNPDIPAGEFVDVLNQHMKAGKIKIFGGSNWTMERLDAANAYAKAKGLQGFSLVSNNFSLARMVKPVWGGCIAASEPPFRAWLKKTRMPLFAWSSQARGFFTDRSAPDKLEDKELSDSWYSEDNFQRKARVYELAKKKGIAPITLALAYVLNQPFPTFPLIGPRQLSETRTSLPALDVTLAEAELKWLNLE